MRTVLIATASYDGKLDIFYVNALLKTIEIAKFKNIDVLPFWICYDALIQRSRNDLMKVAVDNNVDDIIWIDSDIEWNPEWVIKLLEYNYDIVGGIYRKKTDEEELYTVKKVSEIKLDNTILEVEGLGTGFLRMSKKAITALWNNSKKYINNGIENRMVFEVIIDENNELVGEDIYICKKLKELGFSIYLDIEMTCNHIGVKKFHGDFKRYLERFNS